MKTMLLILFLILPASVMAQDRPAVVELVKVRIVTEKDQQTDVSAEFHRLVKAELRRFRNVALVSSKPNYNVYVGIMPLEFEGRNTGYAGAVFVRGADHYWLELKAGRTLAEVARQLAARIKVVLQKTYVSHQ